MKKLNWFVWVMALALGLNGLGARAAEINVSAAASLTEALKEIGADYQKKSKDIIVFNFGASNFLARQIEAGAPGDIFFSADASKMDDLQKEGLIQPETRRNRLSGSLVVVVPSDSALKIASVKDLADPKVKRIALGDPAAVPAGIYARKYLESQKLWEKVSPKVISMDNVRAALAFVESGNVDAGIVYKTDAVLSKKVRVVCEIPRDQGPKIDYVLALLRDAKPEARNFFEFLNSSEASVTFRKYGFVVE
jgi:molybdate transport system substrate-binding protein